MSLCLKKPNWAKEAPAHLLYTGFRLTSISVVDLVQSVPENKHIHSGAEVSICLFWNKAF